MPIQESYRGNVAAMGPRACYDESKRLGETLCYIYHTHLGLHTNVIRPFNVYGPGMQELDYRVLPNFASALKGARALRVYGSGRQTRTFCYVTDALDGFIRVIARGIAGEAYNIGTEGPEIGIADLVDRIERVLGRAVAREQVEYPDSYPALPRYPQSAAAAGFRARGRARRGFAPFLRLDRRSLPGHAVTRTAERP
jgi:UDP-glucuronate decarboxylase